MKITVYVAGPLTDGGMATLNRRERNMRHAIAVGEWLMDRGLFPFVPHLNETWDAYYSHSYDEWMEWCLTFMERCDILYRMEGASEGADIEVARAEELGIPVYDDLWQLVQDWGNNAGRKNERGNPQYAAQRRAGHEGKASGPLWYY